MRARDLESLQVKDITVEYDDGDGGRVTTTYHEAIVERLNALLTILQSMERAGPPPKIHIPPPYSEMDEAMEQLSGEMNALAEWMNGARG